MKIQEIKNIVERYIRQEEQNKNLDFNEFDLIGSGIIDSFFMIKLTDFLENKFGVKFGVDDLTEDNFKNVEKISLLVSKKI